MKTRVCGFLTHGRTVIRQFRVVLEFLLMENLLLVCRCYDLPDEMHTDECNHLCLKVLVRDSCQQA